MTVKLVIPKGRMFDKVNQLLGDAGINLSSASRSYRPTIDDPELSVKLLKAANIPTMIDIGQHDCGFAGYDWVEEQNADLVKVLDLGFDPVKIVVAIPEDWDWEEVKARKFICVSEYRQIAEKFLNSQNLNYTFLRSYGATEVFPPEDADVVIDNTSTGSTLVANRLKIVETVMTSSTWFLANKSAMEDPAKREKIENMALLFKSVLDGRSRVLLEMNCPKEQLEAVIDVLPCMKAPTVAQLYKQEAFAVKTAVKKSEVRDLIPKLLKLGASDILETPIRKVIS